MMQLTTHDASYLPTHEGAISAMYRHAANPVESVGARQWTDWFEGLTVTLEDNGDTLSIGPAA